MKIKSLLKKRMTGEPVTIAEYSNGTYKVIFDGNIEDVPEKISKRQYRNYDVKYGRLIIITNREVLI